MRIIIEIAEAEAAATSIVPSQGAAKGSVAAAADGGSPSQALLDALGAGLTAAGTQPVAAPVAAGGDIDAGRAPVSLAEFIRNRDLARSDRIESI